MVCVWNSLKGFPGGGGGGGGGAAAAGAGAGAGGSGALYKEYVDEEVRLFICIDSKE